MFLRAAELKQKDAPEYVWRRVLQPQGQSIQKEGKALEGAEANLAEIRAMYAHFEARRLPVLRSLGIA